MSLLLVRSQTAAPFASVRGALLERGGAWVTADVYVRSDAQPVRDERTRKFLEDHRVEDNKFADHRAAAAYFDANGFTITRRLAPRADPWTVRETWVLAARA